MGFPDYFDFFILYFFTNLQCEGLYPGNCPSRELSIPGIVLEPFNIAKFTDGPIIDVKRSVKITVSITRFGYLLFEHLELYGILFSTLIPGNVNQN
jgi:hypothetical protein